MAGYLLNISVDASDPKPQTSKEDLTINDQESLIEILFEQILGYENAFEEYDDHDPEDHSKKKSSKIELTKWIPNSFQTFNHCTILEASLVSLPQLFNASENMELDSPPPKS
jgi:hypothetical protein